MFKNHAADRKLKVGALTTNISAVSSALKTEELSRPLLCDVALRFTHPVEADDFKETQGQTTL
ncbi:putative uncharacterized protein C5orf58 [Manis javanica]|nr:putative uncharacterized protein C5orf58 [Manis javanica]